MGRPSGTWRSWPRRSTRSPCRWPATRIEFDPRTACEAAELVRQSELGAGPARRSPGGPQATAQDDRAAADGVAAPLGRSHAAIRTADHQAGAGLDPSDPLSGLLGDLLRRWPLSGVLSDVEEAPLLSLDFGGHPGLLLLYAERLAQNDRPSWRPEPSSPAWEYYEWVLQQRSGPMTVRAFAEGSIRRISRDCTSGIGPIAGSSIGLSPIAGYQRVSIKCCVEPGKAGVPTSVPSDSGSLSGARITRGSKIFSKLLTAMLVRSSVAKSTDLPIDALMKLQSGAILKGRESVIQHGEGPLTTCRHEIRSQRVNHHQPRPAMPRTVPPAI